MLSLEQIKIKVKSVTCFMQIFLFVFFLVPLSQAAGPKYQWIDEKGHKHYSNIPPEQWETANAEQLDNTAEPPAKSQANLIGELEGSVLSGLEKISYDGTRESLERILSEALPAAREGNIIAIHICRQTMYPMGMATGLQALELDSAKPLQNETITAWRAMVEDKANNDDLFYKTVLGILYLNGDGVQKNGEKALSLLAEAAKGGYHDALLKLGMLHNSGQLVPKNMDTALKFYRQAAEGGSVIAFYNMGSIYFHGHGVPVDQKMGFMYYLKSAELGYAPGQTDIGLCYLQGNGVKGNQKEGIRWLQKAAEQGDGKAQYNLSRIGAKLPMVVSQLPGASTSSTEISKRYPREAPKGFREVEIFGLEGAYRYIGNCDTEALDSSLNSDLSTIGVDEKNGWTPLTLAIGAGCENMVKYLIDKGADPNERHRELNFTPLHIAVATGQKNIVEFLLSHDADFNALSTPPSPYYWFSRLKGTSAHIAVMQKNYAMLELLLQKGIDYNIKNSEGYTIYEYAVSIGRREEIERVYDKVGVPVPDLPVTVEELMALIRRCKYEATRLQDEEKVRKLLKSNPNLANERNKFGSTPLHTAAFHNLKKIISLLVVDFGADVNAKDKNGETPLLHNVTDKEIVKILIGNGAQINATDNEGRTILHHYANRLDAEQQITFIKYIIDSGGRKDIRDSYGRLPYDYAVENGFVNVANLLKI